MIYKKQVWHKSLFFSLIFFLFFFTVYFFYINFKFRKTNELITVNPPYVFERIIDNFNLALSIFVYPFLKLQNVIAEPINNQISKIKRNGELENLLQSLKKSEENLRSELISLKGQLQYYKETEEIRQFSLRYELKNAKTVQVLMYVNSPIEHVFFIDAGSKDNIHTDMVALYKNCLIGRVTKVNTFWSKITLITDKSFKIEATCSNTGTQGMLEGAHDLYALKLSFVDHLQPIEIGDYVLSTGNGLVFPAGFALGQIASAQIQDCTYNISVKPLVNFEEIKFCSIIEKGLY